MTAPEIILAAGKRIAATAMGRAFKEGSAEDLLDDPAPGQQGQQASRRAAHERDGAQKRSSERDDTLDKDRERERFEPGFNTDRGRDVGSSHTDPKDDQNSNT